MKKETKSHILLLTCIVAVFFLGSCATHYVPNVVNTPLFRESGEVSLAIHTGISGVDPQFAVAITDNIGLMMNASIANREYESTESSELFKFHKHQFFEAAVGYFNAMDDYLVLEGYAGMGRGRTRAYDDTWGIWGNEQSIDSKFTRIFLQPTIGVSHEFFEGSGSVRLAMVRFDDRQIGTGYYFEPVLTGKGGNKWLKIVLQFGISLQLNSERNPIEYNPFLFSLGLQVKPSIKGKSANNLNSARLNSLH
jgi:hypothetical protein